jgi:hypothetical protein
MNKNTRKELEEIRLKLEFLIERKSFKRVEGYHITDAICCIDDALTDFINEEIRND